MQEAREPSQRCTDLPAVPQVHDQLVVSDLHLLSPGVRFNRQRTLATPPGIDRGLGDRPHQNAKSMSGEFGRGHRPHRIERKRSQPPLTPYDVRLHLTNLIRPSDATPGDRRTLSWCLTNIPSRCGPPNRRPSGSRCSSRQQSSEKAKKRQQILSHRLPYKLPHRSSGIRERCGGACRAYQPRRWWKPATERQWECAKAADTAAAALTTAFAAEAMGRFRVSAQGPTPNQARVSAVGLTLVAVPTRKS